jgi:hypothetical protein
MTPEEFEETVQKQFNEFKKQFLKNIEEKLSNVDKISYNKLKDQKMINKITKTLKKYWKYLLGFIALLLSIFTLNKIRKRKSIEKIDKKINENEKAVEKLEGKVEEVKRQKTVVKKKVVAKKKQIKKTKQQKKKANY